MRAHLVMMARAPRLGRAKRRLAADIGRVPAWAFYRQNLRRVLRRLRHGNWTCWLAVTPDGARLDAPGWRVLNQGRGDLGRRLLRPLNGLAPGPVVVVGADVPDLGPGQVRLALRMLGNHDWVFGPATDGGYWLVGARRRPRRTNPFEKVRWSTEHALDDTLANALNDPRRVRVALIETLSDIDTVADYRAWQRGPGGPS